MESHDALAAEARRREIASLEAALTCLSEVRDEVAAEPIVDRAVRIEELEDALEAGRYKAAELQDELDLLQSDRDLSDWEYYGFSSPEDYVPGRGCGVVGCCVDPDEDEEEL
eukprot:GHVU01183772.1.p2 GENE.GHVU01183772.1~~GHVU01183772.1.p2  ORF type:complete len:128 (-),score=17.85 GHVU01183772.1:1171-1506(-)